MPGPVPKAPNGPEPHPVTTPAGPDAIGTVVHVWSAPIGFDAELGMPIREYLGTGRLAGHLHREQTYYRDVAHFETRAADNLSIPIVDALDGNGFRPQVRRNPNSRGILVSGADGPGLERHDGCRTVGARPLPVLGFTATVFGECGSRSRA